MVGSLLAHHGGRRWVVGVLTASQEQTLTMAITASRLEEKRKRRRHFEYSQVHFQIGGDVGYSE
jgi:hypothetical protein